MMDRNREARRGSMAAGNGGGLSRRRQQRSTNLRDSPEDDGAVEMQESSRLRDRGAKKDRDRDRDRSSSRSKRRRGERLMHVSNREDGDDSSDESMEDDEDDEDEDASVAVRLPPANSTAMPSSSSSFPQQQQQNHHHVRKSGFSAKSVRPPAPSWKVADEMIGVSIPRKARSSALKRSQECWVSGGGGSGELIHRQASTSPARPSPPSNNALSPSSSNASARKKKSIGGSNKHRPPKMAKSAASSIHEIEIEVAEVLYGMTRHPGPPPATNKQESNKVDSKDTNGLSADAKSMVSSPISSSQAPSISQPSVLPSSNLPMVATAPKRKRPRLKFDEESPTSPASSVAPSAKTEPEAPKKNVEGSSPRSEKNTSPSSAVENGIGSCDPSHTDDMLQVGAKPETGDQTFESKGLTDDKEQGNVKEEVSILPSMSMEASCVEPRVNAEYATEAAAKTSPESGSPREEKFSIDLMAPPLPEKSSSDRGGLLDFVSDHKPPASEKKTLPDSNIVSGEAEKVEKASNQVGTSDHQIAGNFLPEESDSKKQTSSEKVHDLQLDLDKHGKDGLSLSCVIKQQQQVPKQSPQPKPARIDHKQEKTAPAASMHLPVPIPGWPGGFPSFGYMGQGPSLQAVVPMDGSSAAAKPMQHPPHFLQPQLRPKRCGTHCYIAQNISYHQQLVLMNPYWSSAAAGAAAPLYGHKQYNLNAVPPSESAAILGNPMQVGFPPRSLAPMQDKNSPAVAMAFTGLSPKEKSSLTAPANGNNYVEAAHRKQFLLQQTPQPGSAAATPNMIGPAFIFPISQQSAVASSRSGASSKSTPGAGNAAPPAASASSLAANSGAAGHPPTTVSFNYAGLSPNDAQYMAILQNSAYPFPIATAHVGGTPAYRGASPAQAMPFFNGPFYSSHLVPSQQQQQQQQQQLLMQQQHYHLMQQQQQQQQQQPPALRQHGHQNPSTSSGSSSSPKHTQQSQQRGPGSGAPSAAVPPGSQSHSFQAPKQQMHLLPHQARQLESETGRDGSPSTADSSRLSQAQKGVYGQNFSMGMHTQNFALISPAAAALAGSGSSGAVGGCHSENKQPGAHQHQSHQGMKVELTPSQAQAYAMSFASFGGSAVAAGAPGFDFSAIVQNPGLLQNLPDVARHGYQIPAAGAQSAQHKKAHHEEGKAVGGSGAANANANANANAATEEGKHKTTAGAGGKSGGGIGQQHSLSFSRLDNDPAMSSFTNIFAEANSQILNGARSLIPPSSSAPTTNSAPNATNSPSSHHMQSQQMQLQQQHMIQFQKQQQQQQRIMQIQQHQQQLQLQQQMSRPAKSSAAHTSSAANVSSDRLSASSTMAARFPQGGLAGFPPALIQGSGPAAQSPQWKASGRAATPAPPATSSSAKNQIPQQQQGRSQHQQPHLNPSGHQTHISFGVNKQSGAGTSNPLSSAAAPAAIAVGFPQNSVSKSSAAAGGGNGGSPRASSNSKPGQPPASVLPTLPLQQQQAAAAASKNSPTSGSNLKSSSPITSNNRNMTSILGHPHVSPSNSSSGKQQSQQQQLQKQSFQQPQLFFNNTYIQAHASQSNAAAAAAAAAAAGYYHQRRQSEQQQQQNSTASGMLSLCQSSSSSTLAGASATSDPAKVAAAAAAAAAVTGIKGLTANQSQPGIMNHTAQYAAAAAAAATSMAQHPFMSAPFQYIHTMPSSVSVKPASAATAAADQKQSTAGGDSSHASWKQEKR